MSNKPHVAISGDGEVYITLSPEVAKRVAKQLITAVGEKVEPKTDLEIIINYMCDTLDKIHGDEWSK